MKKSGVCFTRPSCSWVKVVRGNMVDTPSDTPLEKMISSFPASASCKGLLGQEWDVLPTSPFSARVLSAFGLHPALQMLSWQHTPVSSSSWGGEAQRVEVQGHPLLPRELKAILGYVNPSHKQFWGEWITLSWQPNFSALWHTVKDGLTSSRLLRECRLLFKKAVPPLGFMTYLASGSSTHPHLLDLNVCSKTLSFCSARIQTQGLMDAITSTLPTEPQPQTLCFVVNLRIIAHGTQYKATH